jgi:hypothetical protein
VVLVQRVPRHRVAFFVEKQPRLAQALEELFNFAELAAGYSSPVVSKSALYAISVAFQSNFLIRKVPPFITYHAVKEMLWTTLVINNLPGNWHAENLRENI